MGISAARVRPVLVATAIAATVLLAGCSAAPGAGQSAAASESTGAAAGAAAVLAELGIDASDPVALVDGLESLPVADRPEGFVAQVMPTEVKVQPEQAGELIVPVADDQFYLSVAPYRTQTHPCTFHVPTSCLGELQNTEIQLRITDAASGNVIVDEARTTADNGFTGVWLPRDGEFTVEITADGETATETVRTGAEDPTCITTLQLS
ncbi:CueP family metal-binding protein [Leucobacter chromiireducens]|uniref:CueP family metal-binding protein n=1 Tax=Leucobacter chromiireducens TaxID=283877 RepID=UPI000F63005E|nr:CueP family metal-binding protein [Leucobacter chromiireducens]